MNNVGSIDDKIGTGQPNLVRTEALPLAKVLQLMDCKSYSKAMTGLAVRTHAMFGVLLTYWLR
jgi:hypothetical protein